MEYFSDKELSCKHCGEFKFNKNTRSRLNKLREQCGEPIIINSGYRCEEYNKQQGYTQTHATGQAVDIKCTHALAVKIIRVAYTLGFSGVGIKQKGNINSRYIHLDDLEKAKARPRPHIWSY